MREDPDHEVQFGTSGVRGPATALLAGAAYRHAAAFCRLMAERGTAAGSAFYLGRDRRDSSPAIAAACATAVEAEGFAPVDCGELPTPALALHAMAGAAPAIMISGSHIPADRNGLKFYRPDGEIDKADEAAISRKAAAIGGARAAGALPGPADEAALAGYRERCRAIAAGCRLGGKRIGIYEHSSVSGDIIAELLAAAGASVARHGKSERFTPVDTEAVDPAAAASVAAFIAGNGMDCAVSTDADGDRPLIFDERGVPLPGDLIGYVTALALGARVIVTPVSSNSAIEQSFAGQVVRTRIGSPHVIAALSEAGPGAVGFEANGGVIVGEGLTLGGARLAPLPTRDAAIGLLCTLDASGDAPLSGLAERHGFRAAVKDRIPDFPRDTGRRLVAALAADAQAFAGDLASIGRIAGHDSIDGTRLFFDNGDTLHLRMSGNAPEMRIYAEARSADRARAIAAAGAALARRAMGSAGPAA